jgi:hypothetical protein
VGAVPPSQRSSLRGPGAAAAPGLRTGMSAHRCFSSSARTGAFSFSLAGPFLQSAALSVSQRDFSRSLPASPSASRGLGMGTGSLSLGALPGASPLRSEGRRACATPRWCVVRCDAAARVQRQGSRVQGARTEVVVLQLGSDLHRVPLVQMLGVVALPGQGASCYRAIP